MDAILWTETAIEKNSLKNITVDITNLCKSYENKMKTDNILQQNTNNQIGVCGKKPTFTTNTSNNNIYPIFTAVALHLLDSDFWKKSIEINDNLFYGNLTATQPIGISMNNFHKLIDLGPPSPEESGIKINNYVFHSI